MKEEGLGSLFLRHLVMAIPWGIIILVVFFITLACLKQQIKESIQYSVESAVCEVVDFGFDPRIVAVVKQNLKEGIEYLANTGKNEIIDILNDPKARQNIKETIEGTGEKLRE